MSAPATCCGGVAPAAPAAATGPWQEGWHDDPLGRVPRVRTRLDWRDRLGGWRVRWNLGRGKYRVAPGLYAVGTPGPQDAVLVTANYKLTFDLVRHELGRRNLWLLVIDSRGINVWCAAGKGTFSATEVAQRVAEAKLTGRVAHRTVVLPQLAAPGVAAHEVRQETGFVVKYGPVRARDIGAYLDGGLRATPAQRTVFFPLGERLKVVPVELVLVAKYLLGLALAVAVWNLFRPGSGGPALLRLVLPVTGAALAGTVLVPALLPWLPCRSFALKGLALGLPWAVGCSLLLGLGPWQVAGYSLSLPVLTALLALNFTGSSTYTSQHGVNREIGLFARPLFLSGLAGLLLLLVGLFA